MLVTGKSQMSLIAKSEHFYKASIRIDVPGLTEALGISCL